MSILPRTINKVHKSMKHLFGTKNNNVAFGLHFVNLLNAWIRKTHFTDGLLDENKKKSEDFECCILSNPALLDFN